jgi:hypothetical protein
MSNPSLNSLPTLGSRRDLLGWLRRLSVSKNLLASA